MNSCNDVTSQTVEAREVTNGERMQMLPRHFGRDMLTFENAVYTFMRRLATQYTGGYWTFIELSNGGCYLAPQCEATFHISVDGNGFDGTMSADAAGITARLFALSHLSFQISSESIAEHYHQLRDFALGHQEASAIFAAIDLIACHQARAQRRRSGLFMTIDLTCEFDLEWRGQSALR